MGRFRDYLTSWLTPRAQTGDTSDLVTPTQWLTQAIGGYLSRSHILVSPTSALSVSTYYACIRNISEDVGKLPLFTYRRLDERTRDKARAHPLYTLLHDAPNPDMTAFTFRQLLTQDVLGWGNGYAWIERDIVVGRRPVQQVLALWPLHPSRVRKRRLESGEIVYDVTASHVGSTHVDTQIEVTRLPASDVLHLVGFTHDGYEGISVLQYAADSLGIALSAQDYGQAFFRNSAQPSGVLSHPKALSKEAQERLRTEWKARFGAGGTQQDIAVLEEGMVFTPLTIPNNQAQFLETREFQVKEIARWFRMPLSKLNETRDLHYNSMEQLNIEYVQDTLAAWLVRWEQTLKLQLFGLQSDYFAEHSVNALLRGDSIARARFYKELFGMAGITPNEIRAFEGMNGLGSAGETPFVASNNYRTLKSAIQMSTDAMPGTRNGLVPSMPGRNGQAPHDEDEDEED